MPNSRSNVVAISDQLDRLIVFEKMLLGLMCLFIAGGVFFCMIRSFVGFSSTGLPTVTCVLFLLLLLMFGTAGITYFFSTTTSLATEGVRHDLNFCTC